MILAWILIAISLVGGASALIVAFCAAARMADDVLEQHDPEWREE